MIDIEEEFKKLLDEYYSKVTRLETVDNIPCTHCKGQKWIDTALGPKECGTCSGVGVVGRSVVFWDKSKQIELSLQDDGRTLKIFITKRGEQ